MYREHFVQQIVRTIFSPWYLGAVAALVALSMVSGLLSLRILKRMPEFPRKRVVVWGARWCWTLLLATFLCMYAIAYLGVTQTDYLLTAIGASQCFLWLAFIWLQFALHDQFYGESLWIPALASRIRRRPVEIEGWLAKGDRFWARSRGLILGTSAIMLLGYGYVALAFTYPFDVELAAQFRAQDVADQLGLAMRGTTIGSRVQKVEAFVFSTEPDWVEGGGEPETARWSFRKIFGHVKPPQSEHRLLIRVTKDSTLAQKREVLAQAQKLLADQHEPHHWSIAVYSRGSRVAVRGPYPPKESDD